MIYARLKPSPLTMYAANSLTRRRAAHAPHIPTTHPTSPRVFQLWAVSLPRLKLTFQARRVGDEVRRHLPSHIPSQQFTAFTHLHAQVRLYSVDHADLFVTNERSPETTELLAGIPHSLLLSNSNGEISVLVPSVPPVRPKIGSVPFSTELVLDRSDAKWAAALENPFYVYPVHVSLCFLYSTTLASALYLLLLRYMGRQYRAVVQLSDTIASDTDLAAEEAQSVAFLNSPRNSADGHPDAHACRLKISLVMLDSPVSPPWELSVEMSAYVRSAVAHTSDPPAQAGLQIASDDRAV